MVNIFVRDRIKEICKEKNMTVTHLAEEAGISRQQFFRDSVNFRLDNVAAILTVLDCKFEDAFEIVRLDSPDDVK